MAEAVKHCLVVTCTSALVKKMKNTSYMCSAGTFSVTSRLAHFEGCCCIILESQGIHLGSLM